MDGIANAFESLVNQSAANVSRNEADYISPEDGLLWCGKCRTPKQCRVTVLGREFTPYCPCECEQERLAAEKKAFEERQKAVDGARLRTISGVTGNLADSRFEKYGVTADNERAYRVCKRYADRFGELPKKNQGLLLWGGVGTGKTFSAACIANSLLDRGVPVIFTSFVQLLGIGKGFGVDEEFIAELNRAALLIIDDFGAERSTDFALEKVYSIIDGRYTAGKPMVITTNLDLDEMMKCRDVRFQRVYERVLETCYPVKFEGKSRRKETAKNRFEEMEAFLK
ncbi:MAG: ATP-binding protein [Ruminococcus sp.]|nr:ATP-binding protein [Ruminococcus sp.]MCM1381371.1 ATP-binding protein [Muribaculaceae bacterium]MCM1480283.1 ATP-binding protein [Muribaculaceae bacterium]